MSYATGPTEKRLEFLQVNPEDWDVDERVVQALCEIVRQLTRIADLYEEVHK